MKFTVLFVAIAASFISQCCSTTAVDEDSSSGLAKQFINTAISGVPLIDSSAGYVDPGFGVGQFASSGASFVPEGDNLAVPATTDFGAAGVMDPHQFAVESQYDSGVVFDPFLDGYDYSFGFADPIQAITDMGSGGFVDANPRSVGVDQSQSASPLVYSADPQRQRQRIPVSNQINKYESIQDKIKKQRIANYNKVRQQNNNKNRFQSNSNKRQNYQQNGQNVLGNAFQQSNKVYQNTNRQQNNRNQQSTRYQQNNRQKPTRHQQNTQHQSNRQQNQYQTNRNQNNRLQQNKYQTNRQQGNRFPNTNSQNNFQHSGTRTRPINNNNYQNSNNLQGVNNQFPGSGTSNIFPGTRNDYQGTNSNFQGTGNNFPLGGSNQQGTNNNFPGSGSNFQGVGNYPAGNNNNLHGTGIQFPTPSNNFPGAGVSGFQSTNNNFQGVNNLQGNNHQGSGYPVGGSGGVGHTQGTSYNPVNSVARPIRPANPNYVPGSTQGTNYNPASTGISNAGHQSQSGAFQGASQQQFGSSSPYHPGK